MNSKQQTLSGLPQKWDFFFRAERRKTSLKGKTFHEYWDDKGALTLHLRLLPGTTLWEAIEAAHQSGIPKNHLTRIGEDVRKVLFTNSRKRRRPMATVTLRQDILAETFEDVKGDIKNLVNNFISNKRIARLDWDKYWSEAQYGFIKAVDKYNGRVPLPKWILWRIHKNLYDLWRKDLVRSSREVPMVNEEGKSVEPGREERTFFLLELTEELSNDARTVVGLVLDTPKHKGTRGGQPASIKNSLQKHLLKKLGWSRQKIEETFEEIRTALET